MYLVSENCLPFEYYFSNKLNKDDVVLLIQGSRCLLFALHFLHSNVGLSHNNIRFTSIFIDSYSNWKLCGFEFSLKFELMSVETIQRIEFLKNENDKSV